MMRIGIITKDDRVVDVVPNIAIGAYFCKECRKGVDVAYFERISEGLGKPVCSDCYFKIEEAETCL